MSSKYRMRRGYWTIDTNEPGMWYCVVRIVDSKVLYVGQGLGSAVAALIVGTCWAKSLGGKGTAQATAKGNAHRFRQTLGIEKQ